MQNGYQFLLNLDLASLVAVFWFFILFEIPRYTLSALAVGLRAAFRTPPPDPDPQMPISVLLVGHNEAKRLPRAVMGLHEQTHRNLQVVVVDDGSNDGMSQVGEEMKRRGLVDIFLTSGLRGGKASALNLGLKYCRHNILVVMDIDTSLDRDAIARCVAPLLEDPQCGAASGNIAVRNPDASLLTAFQAIEYFGNISIGRQFTSMFGILAIVSGAFGAFRKDAILNAGGWDVGPGDDSNLTTKLRRGGWQIKFAPDAWALTDVPDGHGALLRQRLRWNRSLIRNRLRKFRGVFDPFQENFTFADMMAGLNLIWFHLLLAITFVIYLVFTLINYADLAITLFVAIHILAIVGDLIEFAIAVLFTRRPGMWKLWPYVVGYTLYVGYYQRLIRIVAYVSELVFRHSYDDPFYPQKVRQAQEQF